MTAATPSTAAWREVLALFDRWAQAGDDTARAAALQGAEAQHPALYPRLLAMIEADRAAEAGRFMTEGSAMASLAAAADAPAAGGAGTRLGAWELREPIGHGGMGQVWLATRHDGLYQGRAAVKLLHAAGLNALAEARFAREGEMLARLAHPHIAQLLDAGLTGQGMRYLVLEYVQGVRIDHWCDARTLGIAPRLRLFLQVCEAVGYAHTHLVLHRDLKPANILVTDDGHVKLLDFGVAKLMGDGEDAAGSSELTREGAAGLTPEYAAPEQIEGQAVTTATDVYALGVVLFGLLSGARPYAESSRGVAALARAVVEEPPRSLTAALRASPDAAPSRGSTLAALEHGLRGDLETIVAKALKKRPEERYATVRELRDDLQRHLDRQPVSARPDTWRYRASRFAQRNRALVAAGAALGLTLVAGIAATSWQWRAATLEAQRTHAVVKVLTDIFTDLTPDESGTAQVPVVDLLRKGWKQAQTSLAHDPALRGEVARPLGLMLGSSGDMQGAIAALSTSREHLLATGQANTAPYLQVLQALAYAQSRVGQVGQARQLFSEIITRGEQAGLQGAEEPVNARIQLGEIARREGQLEQSRTQLQAAADLARRQLGPTHALHVLALQELADVMRELGDWQETQRLLASIASATAGGKPDEALVARFNVATLEAELGHFRQSADQLQPLTAELVRLYGENDTYTLYARTWHSMALFSLGAYAESDAALDAAWRGALQTTEPNVRQTVQTVMARQLLRRGRCAQAEPLLRETLAHFEAAGSTGRPYAERSRMLLGECELRAGRIASALQTLQLTLAHQQAFYGGRAHLDLWPTLLLIAIATDSHQGASAALPHYERAGAMAAATLPPEHPDRARLQLYLAQARARAQPTAQSRRELAAALQAWGAATRGRSDPAALSVLSRELLEPGPAAPASRQTLLALLIP